jgi:hypothetical protein
LMTGVDGVAFPSEHAVKFVREKGYDTVFLPYCCAQICWELGHQKRSKE